MLKKMTILSALLALILVDLLKAQGESKIYWQINLCQFEIRFTFQSGLIPRFTFFSPLKLLLVLSDP